MAYSKDNKTFRNRVLGVFGEAIVLIAITGHGGMLFCFLHFGQQYTLQPLCHNNGVASMAPSFMELVHS